MGKGRERERCDSCLICTGAQEETELYRVGKHFICGWCLKRLQAAGRVEIETKGQDGRKRMLKKETALYLHPDGKVSRELVKT